MGKWLGHGRTRHGEVARINGDVPWERLVIVSLTMGRDRLKKYWGKVIVQDMVQP